MQIARQFPGPSVNILITGAYGFIGRNCAAALEKDGHSVIRGGRGPRQIGHAPCGHLEIDFAQDFDPQVWKSRLEGVDLVLNTVGAMAPSRSASLGDLHARAPIALFDACAQLGIRAINISALGADEGAQSEFHRTKKAADDHLLSLQPNAAVVLPSLVYGPGGASAQLFDTLASLPLIALPAGGNQQVQPVHIDDLVELVTILSARPVQGGRIPAVGPAPLALREFI